jgi:hypothetical protein
MRGDHRVDENTIERLILRETDPQAGVALSVTTLTLFSTT